jgi:hypothetical protein
MRSNYFYYGKLVVILTFGFFGEHRTCTLAELLLMGHDNK